MLQRILHSILFLLFLTPLIGQVTYTVVDTTACINTVSVGVAVSNFTDVSAFSYTMTWDETKLQYQSVSDFNLTHLNQSAFGDQDAVSMGKLYVSWTDNDLFGKTLPDGTVIYYVNFIILGGTGDMAQINIIDDDTPFITATGFPPTTVNPVSESGTVSFGDFAPPSVTCPGNVTVQSPTGNPVVVSNDLSPTIMDNCDSNPQVTYTSDATPPHNGNDDATGETFPIGTTTVTYTATDDAALSADCSFTVTVEDNNNTVFTFIASDATIDCSGNPVQIDISGENFIDMTTLSFTFMWDPTVVEFSSIGNFNLQFLDNGDFNLDDVANGKFTMSWFDDDATGENLADNETIFSVFFNPAGNAGANTALMFLDDPTNLIAAHSVPPVEYPVEVDNGSVAVNTYSATLNGDATICSGESTNLSINISGGVSPYTIIYNDGNGNIQIDDYQANDPIPVSPNTTTTYTLMSVADANGCNGILDDDSATVTINQGPSAATILGDADTCPGDTTNLSVAITGGTAPYTIVYTENIPGTTNSFTITNYQSNDPIMVHPEISTVYDLISVTDASGCILMPANESALVAANDEDIPVLTCPTPITQNTDSGACGAIVTFADATATDNCDDEVTPILITSLPSGSEFPVGESTVTFQGNDDSNNAGFCSFTVTITDNEPPQAVNCSPFVFPVSADAGQCGAIVTFTEPSATDNCAVVDSTATHNSGDFFPIGTTNAMFTFEDASGNSVPCTTTITVNDNEAPAITCPSDITMAATSTDCSATVTWSDPTVTDNCAGATFTNTSTFSSGDTFPFGVTGITYQATDASGNTASCDFSITIFDETPPVFDTCPTSQTVEPDMGGMTAVVNNIAPTVSDNCGIAMTSYNLTGVTTGMGNDDASGTAFNLGETTITYTTEDVNGLTNTCVFTINVVNNAPLSLECPDNQIVVSTADSCGVTIFDIAPTAMPISKLDTIFYELTGATTGTGGDDASGIFYNIGTTTIIYTATDNDGAQLDCSFSITVNDTIAPVFTLCPTDITNMPNDAGMCGAVVNYDSPIAMDDCSAIDTIVCSTISGEFFPVGTTTVTCIATDVLGNMSQDCVFDVTVIDTENPMIECPASQMVAVNMGDTTAVVNNIAPIVSDNCGIDTTFYNLTGATTGAGANDASGTAFELGETTVTYTTEDINGLTNTCTFTINVVNNGPLNLNCPANQTVISAADSCGVTIFNIAPTVTPIANLDTIIYELMGATTGMGGEDASGIFYNVDTTIVTYIATDNDGNEVSCSFTLTVNDTISPVFTLCPSDIIGMPSDSAMCGALVDYENPMATDDCHMIDTIICSNISGSFFPVGTTTITCTAIDVLGNMSENCVFDITVVDAENPIIECPVSQTVAVDMGDTSAVVNNIAPIVSDNCGIDTTFYNLTGATTGEGANDASGTAFQLGETSITYTTVDQGDSTAMCAFTITVIDNVALMLECPENQVVYSPADTCGMIVEGIAPTVSPMSELDTVTYELTGATTGTGGNDASGIFYNIGNTTVVYTATDNDGAMLNCSFSIMVNDTIMPVIDNCPTDISINVAAGECSNTATWTAPIASDNCTNLNMTSTHESGDEFMVGNTIVSYLAADGSGNQVTCSFTVTVTDNILPAIDNCPDDIEAFAETGDCFAIATWILPTISDNCPGATLSSNNDSGDQFDFGANEVIYIGSDANGNQATCSFTVTVIDTEAPVITDCPEDMTLPADGADCSATVTWTEPTVTDNCPEVFLTGNPASGSVFQSGTTTVNYIATDFSGNTAACSFTVTVADNQAPMGTFCPPNMAENALQNECSAIITWQEPTFEDDCGVISVISNHMSGDTFDVNGPIMVVYTANDAAGNTSECTFTVEVIDNQPPIIFSVPEDIIMNNDPGLCGAVVNYIMPQAFDNCGVSGFVTSHPSGTEFPIGTTTVTFTASDLSGNVMNESFTITIEDNEPPKPACPETVEITVDGTNLNDPSGNVISFSPVDCDSIFIELTEPTVTDNCQMASFEQTAGIENTSETPFPVGTTLMEFTAMDASGNESICAFNVIVNPVEFPAINLNTIFPCEGDEFIAQIESYPNATFNWFNENNELINTGSAYALSEISLMDAGAYIIEMVLPSCTVSEQFQLTVFEKPQLEAAANDIVCTDGNQPLNLTATIQNGAMIDNWQWLFNGSPFSMEQNPTIENATENNAGEYIVRAISNNGCLAVDTIIVEISTVAQMPTLVAEMNNEPVDIICTETTFDLIGQSYFGNSVEYFWSASSMTGNGLIAVNNFNTTATPTEAGTYVYSFYAIVDGCQTDEAQYTVIVEAPPVLTPEVVGNLTCVDGTTPMTLMANYTDSDATYTWTFNGDFLSNNENVTIDNISPDNNGEYKLIVTLPNGCQAEGAIDVVITEQPNNPNPLGISPSQVCLGEEVTITATNYGADANYIWAGEGIASPGPQASIITVIPTAVGSFEYTFFVNKDGCTTEQVAGTLEVEAAPTANLAIDGETICLDGFTPVTLLSNNTDAANSFWLNENNIQVASTSDFTLENANAGDSGNYYFVAESAIGCQNIDTINVQITDGLPPIEASLIGQPCEDGNLTLSSTNIQNASYTWTNPAGTEFSSAQDPLVALASPEFNGTYIVVAQTADGCSTTDSVDVEILTAPTAIDDEVAVITDSSTEFNVLLNDGFDGNQNITVTVLQSTAQGTLTELGDGTFSYRPNEGSLETDMFAYQICYDACPNTCDIAFVQLDVQFEKDNCIATTVITPNNDGVNDRFVVFCLDIQDFPDNELIIFGSWGDEVFRMTGYDNTWKGTYEGEPLPDGTYYYIFKRDPDAEPEKGFVMIYR